MNALATDWFPEANRLVIALAPDVAGRVPPSESELAAAVKRRRREPWPPTSTPTPGRALMERPPAPGRIVKTTLNGNVTEWTLSNGATVALLPTTLKADQILFMATAPGGTSLAKDADFFAARVADDVIPAGGVGRVVRSGRRQAADRKIARRPAVHHGDQRRHARRQRAARSRDDVSARQFTLYRAACRSDGVRRDESTGARHAGGSSGRPEVLFSQTLASALSANHARRQPETAATVAKWNLDTSLAFYKARFADASNFRFVFVGSFTLETMRPLIETYIASLPATHGHETWRDLGVKLPGDVVQTTVRKGIAPKSSVAIVFSGPFEFTSSSQLALQTATMLLQSRLSETIREQLGATYAISADSETSRYPRPEYRVSIDWTCDPAKVESLVQRVSRR